MGLHALHLLACRAFHRVTFIIFLLSGDSPESEFLSDIIGETGKVSESDTAPTFSVGADFFWGRYPIPLRKTARGAKNGFAPGGGRNFPDANGGQDENKRERTDKVWKKETSLWIAAGHPVHPPHLPRTNWYSSGSGRTSFTGRFGADSPRARFLLRRWALTGKVSS